MIIIITNYFKSYMSVQIICMKNNFLKLKFFKNEGWYTIKQRNQTNETWSYTSLQMMIIIINYLKL